MKTVHSQSIFLKILILLLSFSFISTTLAAVPSEDGYGSSSSSYEGPYDLSAPHEVNVYYQDAAALADLQVTIYQELLSWGMTHQGASAVMGNIYAECSYDPTLLQNWVSWDKFSWGNTGAGLIQWTYWSLQADLFNTAYRMGKSWTDLGVQFEAMKHHFGPSERSASYLYTEGAGTAYDLAGKFMDDFEKPAVRNYVRRGNAAVDAFNSYSGLSPESYSGTYDVNSQGSTNSGVSSSLVMSTSEWNLHGMPKASGLASNLRRVYRPESLEDYDELSSVTHIGQGIKDRNELKAWEVARTVIVFAGLVFIMYAVFLSVALILDIVNNFIDLEFVSLISFGALHYTPTPDKMCTNKKYVSFKRMLVIIGTVFCVGVLCVSGGVFSFIMKYLYTLIN